MPDVLKTRGRMHIRGSKGYHRIGYDKQKYCAWVTLLSY